MGERVVVGMSGGVDSALAAALLVERGYDVLGVYMRNWTADLPGFTCPWATDLADAERVAVGLGIDLEVWDYEAEYKREVVDHLVDCYQHGITPNPDVICNEKIKFGLFAERALSRGADYIATGHYARTVPGTEVVPGTNRVPGTEVVPGTNRVPGTGRVPGTSGTTGRLLRAADEHKDQTYFLWRVPGTVLSRTLFPIGDIPDKGTVREMARERGIEVAGKKDSTGICFIGDIGIRQFLLSQLDSQPGDIIDHETGERIGRHDGAFLYTVGQRRGLGIGGGPVRYVVRTDTKAGIVYVTSDRECPLLWMRELHLRDTHWIAGHAPRPGHYEIRTRHTRALVGAVVEHGQGATAHLVLDRREPAIAPGQSVVVYDGLECLGGGILERC